jgi:HK97 family phage major capsid protein
MLANVCEHEMTDLSNLPRLSELRAQQKGLSFARYALALAIAKGDLALAAQVAARWHDSPVVELCCKAAANAGTTTSTTWAAPIATQYATMVNEFIDLLRPATILGKLQGVRRVPFNVRTVSKTQSSAVGWTGQGAPSKVSELGFSAATLALAKISGIVVLARELLLSSDPSAEFFLRQDLIDTIAQYQDQQFIDPSVVAVANVSPASATSGLTAVSSSGNTLSAVIADAKAAIAKLTTAGILLRNPYWIMRPSTALAIGTLTDSAGAIVFPTIGAAGGMWLGIPAVTSASVPSTTSGGSVIVLLDANEIFLAEGEVELDASENAAIQMSDSPVAGASTVTSLWQANCVGVRADKYTNWAVRRAGAVTYIDAVMF